MKYVLLILGLMISIPTFAGNGGPSGVISPTPGNGGPSGGNALRSTLDDIQHYVTNPEALKRAVISVMSEVQREMNRKGDVLTIKNPELRDIFSKMQAKKSGKPAVFSDLAATKIKLDTEPGCEFIQKLKTEAATVKQEFGADICINSPLLRRLPKEALPRELTALVVHEMSHHFGADEAVASDLQTFVMYKLYSQCKVEVDFNEKEGNKGFFIYPRNWNFWNEDPQEFSFGTSIKVVNNYSFIHKPNTHKDSFHNDNVSEVNLQTNNSPDEFSMEINKKGKSSISFMVLNKDLTRTKFEVTWQGVQTPWPVPPGTAQITGILDGKGVDFDMVNVTEGCFNDAGK